MIAKALNTFSYHTGPISATATGGESVGENEQIAVLSPPAKEKMKQLRGAVKDLIVTVRLLSRSSRMAT
jgi:hypothetical protein